MSGLPLWVQIFVAVLALWGLVSLLTVGVLIAYCQIGGYRERED